VIHLYLEKLYNQFPELKPPDKKKDVQQSILQESDSLLYEKFKKFEAFEYIFVKSFSEPPTADTLMLSNFKNKSVLYESNPEMDNEPKTQEKTNLFEVSLEPSFKEQSRRLSILGKITTNINISNKKEVLSSREKAHSFHLDLDKKKKKKKKKKEEFPERSTILTTTRYFKSSEEIRKLIENKHKMNILNESDQRHEMHNLDDFFAKKINHILLRKCKNRPMQDVQTTYIDYLKDEDFDKKEFDFSKKMLRHKKSYSMGKIKSDYLESQEEKDQLNFMHPRGVIRKEIKELLTKNNIIENIDRTKSAQEEEKTSNFCSKLCQRSSIIMGAYSSPNPIPVEIQSAQLPKIQNNQIMKESNKIVEENEDAGKAKLQNLIMKHRVTFELKKMVEQQRKNSLEGKGAKEINGNHRRSFSEKQIKDESKETLEKYHKNTKEMIQKMAENVSKDLEGCDKMIVELKGSLYLDEQRKLIKKKEQNAKKLHIVKKNWELSKSMKNISIKKEVFENFQNQLNAISAQKLAMKQNNVIHPVLVQNSGKIY